MSEDASKGPFVFAEPRGGFFGLAVFPERLKVEGDGALGRLESLAQQFLHEAKSFPAEGMSEANETAGVAAAMGEISFQGESPFVLPTAQPATIRVAGTVVELTVYASVPGQPPHAFPVLIRIPADAARQLSSEMRQAVLSLKEGR